MKASVKPKDQIFNATYLIGQGLEKEDKCDFTNAKPYFMQGSEKMKNLVINSTLEDKELVFEYVKIKIN